jgi:hypothetical protein
MPYATNFRIGSGAERGSCSTLGRAKPMSGSVRKPCRLNSRQGPPDHPDNTGRWSSSHPRALHLHSELNVLNGFCPGLTLHSFEEILSWAQLNRLPSVTPLPSLPLSNKQRADSPEKLINTSDGRDSDGRDSDGNPTTGEPPPGQGEPRPGRGEQPRPGERDRQHTQQ